MARGGSYLSLKPNDIDTVWCDYSSGERAEGQDCAFYRCGVGSLGSIIVINRWLDF